MNDSNLALLLKQYKHVHFIGIGGISMSALAEILHNKGYIVTGSDITENDSVKKLKNLGLHITIGHHTDNIAGAQIIIYTAAIKEDNPELAQAHKNNIPVFSRSQLLACVMSDYPYPIAIAGTHGKTTTTSLVSEILIAAGKDPTCLVGGQLSAIGGNFRIGKSDYMVCEACEYVDSFLTLTPRICVILNVEADHLDYFSDLSHIKTSFTKFARLCGEDGLCIVCGDDQNALDCVRDVQTNKIIYGISPVCDISANNVKKTPRGYPSFDIVHHGQKVTSVELKIPGSHNILNSLAAAAIAVSLSIEPQYIKEGLENFTGTKRRFERLGEINGGLIVDDYAHHPTEIKATLAAARTLGFKRIICIFQPHTYSRTYSLFDDFVNALSLADVPVLSKIYPARETNRWGISAKSIADQLGGAPYFEDFEDIANYIQENAREGDLILTMGAGDIYKAGLLALSK